MILYCLLQELKCHETFAFKAVGVPPLFAFKNSHSTISLHIACSCSIFTCHTQAKVALRL